MNELFANINWVAVIVSTIIAFIAWHAWYSPKTFGKKWAEWNKISMDKPHKWMACAMISQFISTFLLALLIGITAKSDDLFMALLIVLTIIFFISSNWKWAQKPKYVIMVDTWFILVMFIIMVATHGIL